MIVYVLTREHNAYDQYGEYYVAVFPTLPSVETLTDCGVLPYEADHVRNGGGRVGDEDVWFNLREVRLSEQ